MRRRGVRALLWLAVCRYAVAGLLILTCTQPVFASPPVTALAVAPDGKELLVGSQAGIVVRSLPSLEVVRELDTGLSAIHEVRFAPDGKQFIKIGGTAGEAGGWELCNWPSGERVMLREDFDDVAYSGDWSANGQELVIASDDLVLVYRGPKFAEPQVLAGHSRRVLAVRFLPSVEMLVSSGSDQSIRVFQTVDGQPLRTLRNHTGDVYDLEVRPGASPLPMVASCGADRTVRFWQPTIGRLVRFVRLAHTEPLAVAWTRDGSYLLVACSDGRLRIVDPQTASIDAQLSACDGWAYEVAVADDGLAIVGGANGQLRTVQLDLPSTK